MTLPAVPQSQLVWPRLLRPSSSFSPQLLRPPSPSKSLLLTAWARNRAMVLSTPSPTSKPCYSVHPVFVFVVIKLTQNVCLHCTTPSCHFSLHLHPNTGS